MPTPTESPTIRAITEAGGVEVTNRKGIQRIQGAGLRQLSTDTVLAIAHRFGNERVADLLDELCGATVVTRGGTVLPDNRTRLAATSLVLAYLVGRPVERQEIVSVNLDADSATGLAERLRSSPALRESLKRLIGEAESVAVALDT